MSADPRKAPEEKPGLIRHMEKVAQQISSWPRWQQELLAKKLKSKPVSAHGL